MRMSSLPLLGLVLTAALPSIAQASSDPDATTEVFGTRSDQVMVMVSAQFSEDLDEQIWLEPLAAVEVADSGNLSLTLEGVDGLALTMPLAEGRDAASSVEIVQGAIGHLLRLEYHPAQLAPRGRIHASWTLSSEKSLVGRGDVRMVSRLYSQILSVAPDDLPDTGIFASIANVQNRYGAFVDHALTEDAHETGVLYEGLLGAVENANTPLSFYRKADGGRVTEEHLTELLETGRVRSADLYWREAVAKFDTMEPVNELLNAFVEEWNGCPAGTEIVGPFPGDESERLVDIGVIDEFRRAAARRFLAEAVLCAEAENPWLMAENLERFHLEIDAAGDVGQEIDPNDFVPENYETIDEFEAHLGRKASGRLNTWERMLAYFQTLKRNNQNFASPVGR